MIRRRAQNCRRHPQTLSSSLRGFGSLAIAAGLLLTHIGCSTLGRFPAVRHGNGPASLRGQDSTSADRTSGHATSEKTRDLIQRATGRYRAGKLEAALKAVRAARHADPRLAVTLQMEAQICLDMGDHEGHLEALRAVLLASPQSARLHNAAGRLLVYAGEFEEGTAALKKAIALSPHSPEYARDLAAVYFGRQQTEAADDVLVAALEQTPHDVSLPIALARLHEAGENWESAACYYEVVLECDPENPVWHRQLARSLYQLGEHERACRHFAECGAGDESAISLAEHVLYGDACLQLGEFGRAQHIFDEVARRSPYRLKEIELLRGFCALNRGDAGHAKGILTTALEQWPEDETLQEAISLCDAAESDD